MLINATTAITTSSILLVPYSAHHVQKYHEWMQDEEIQQATASEPLTLEEEYSMQRSWREDADKLTFIACLPLLSYSSPKETVPDGADAPDRMIGDVNLFLRFDEDDESRGGVIGEIELMIADKQNQGKGFGRGALLTFLRYILENADSIVGEFLRAEGKEAAGNQGLSCLSVKIGQANSRSLSLFESLGFVKVTKEPNYFGEYELRREDLDVSKVEDLFPAYAVSSYRQLNFAAD